MGLGLFTTGTPVLIQEKTRLRELEDFLHRSGKRSSPHDNHNSPTVLQSTRAGYFQGFSLNVWAVALWKTLKELPQAPVFGFLEYVSLESPEAVKARLTQQALHTKGSASHRRAVEKNAALLSKGRAIQILDFLGALNTDDFLTRNGTVPLCLAMGHTLAHRCLTSRVAMMFDSRAES